MNTSKISSKSSTKVIYLQEAVDYPLKVFGCCTAKPVTLQSNLLKVVLFNCWCSFGEVEKKKKNSSDVADLSSFSTKLYLSEILSLDFLWKTSSFCIFYDKNIIFVAMFQYCICSMFFWLTKMLVIILA